MAKAKIKVVDREAAKQFVYSATFGTAGTIRAALADFYPMGLNPVQSAMAFNGLTQKLNDSHAGAESAKEAFDWTAETLKVLTEGKWTVRVPGEGGPRGGDFYKAVAEFKGITEAEAREKIAAMIEDLIAEDDKVTEKMGFARIKAAILKKYPQIQEIVNRLKAERIAKVETVEVEL